MNDNKGKEMCFLLSLLSVAVLLLGCSDRITTYYPTHAAAVKEGSVQRGWIPEMIPTSATEIYEQHNLDTNEVWLRFNIPIYDRDKMITGLRKLSQQEIQKMKFRYPSMVNWWFEGFIQQSPANDNALNADIYIIKSKDKNKSAYLALDRSSSKIYYWDAYE